MLLEVVPMTMRTENKTEESLTRGDKQAKKGNAKQNAPKEKSSVKQQPHPEQLRIAQLLDNAKSEDPKLKEKLKQIMEATQKSMDEAFVALHDSDYDPNKAVNLLLEGCEAEWSTLLKKKKTKSPSGTQERTRKEEVPKQDPEESHWETSLGTKPVLGNRGGNVRGRGRGGSFQGGRNKNLQDQNNFSKRRQFPTPAADDDSTPTVIETRYFERARTPVVRPVDTWDPNKPVSSLLNKGIRPDDDEEEYTGSLAKSLVITSSCFGKNSHPEEVVATEDKKIKTGLEKTAIPSAPQVLSQDKPLSTSNACSQGQSVSPSLAFPQDRTDSSTEVAKSPLPNSDNLSKSPSIGTRAPPITASIIKAPPRIERAPPLAAKTSSPSPLTERSSNSEIPATPVVMPPDCVSNVRLLDVTFGTVDFNEKDIKDSIPSVNHTLAQQLSTKQKFPDRTSERRSSKDLLFDGNSSDSPHRVPDHSKSPGNSFYETSIAHSSYAKTAQKPRSVQNAFPTEALCSPNKLVHPAVTTTAYSSSPPVAAAVSSACPQIHYSSLTTQGTQPHPIIPNSYQNVLGNQTYTSNSQYGSSILPSSSFSIPYPSYSSMVQQSQKQPTTSSPFTKELEGSTSGIINSMSYSGMTNSSLAANAIPCTKPTSSLPTSLGKSNVMSNMPTLMGPHQIILGQGGMPYFQQPLYYQDLHLMQQQRLTTHLNPGYYDYSSTNREGASFHMSDKMFPLVQHSSHPPAASNEHVNSSMVYGDNFSAHYAGICVSGHEASNARTDGFKSSIQTPLNQPVLSSVKPVASASKIGSYE